MNMIFKSIERTNKNSWQNKNKIRSQQIRESCGIQSINEWIERRRRRKWDEHITRMDVERYLKSQGRYPEKKVG